MTGDSQDQGWIKLHRQIMDSAVWSDPVLLRMWVYFLLRANYKARFFKPYGLAVPVKLEPGQFWMAGGTVAKALGLTRSTAERMMKRNFIDTGMMTLEPSPKGTLATVVNWEAYQGSEEDPEQQVNSRRAADGQQVNTDKKEKKVKNDEKKTVRKAAPKKKKQAKAKRKKTPTDPRVREFIDWFFVEFQAVTGRKYIVQGAKDGLLVKKLIAALGDNALPELKRATGNMFADLWGRKKAGIGLLSSQINSWLMDPNAKAEVSKPRRLTTKEIMEQEAMKQQLGDRI